MMNGYLSYASISAFHGHLLQVSANSRPINVLQAPKSCAYWCITYQTCVSVVVQPNNDSECYYSTSTSGKRISNTGTSEYEISRVCTARAKSERRIRLLIFYVCDIYMYVAVLNNMAKRKRVALQHVNFN